MILKLIDRQIYKSTGKSKYMHEQILNQFLFHPNFQHPVFVTLACNNKVWIYNINNNLLLRLNDSIDDVVPVLRIFILDSVK